MDNYKSIKKITVPASDANLSEYWGELYSVVYCYFKPFYKTTNLSWFESLIISNIEDINKFYLENTPVSWSVVSNSLGFYNSLELFNIYRDKKQEAKDYYIKDSNYIISPYFDGIAPYQIEIFYQILKELDYTEVILIDNYNVKKLIQIEDFIKTLKQNFGLYFSILTPDEKLFIGNGFDYLSYGFICYNGKDIIDFNSKIEGFVCDFNSSTWNPLPV